MIKRVRDKIRKGRPEEVISFEDWADIEDRYICASTFLAEDNFACQAMRYELKEAEERVLTNRIHDVKEVRIIGDIQRIFSTDKEEQINEAVGQIKFMRGFLDELQSWVDRKIELERLEAEGTIIIRRKEEDENVSR